MNSLLSMQTGLVLLLSVASIGVPTGDVKADQTTAFMSLLQGDYGASGSISCAADNAGFNSSTLGRLGSGGTDSFSVEGALHYNGDGTGTALFTTLRVNQQSNGVGQQPIEQARLNCDIVYSVNNDGTFNQRSTCQGMTLAGFPAVGATFTTASNLQGNILLSGKVLFLSNTVPDVETLSRSTGLVLKVICARSLVAIRTERQ